MTAQERERDEDRPARQAAAWIAWAIECDPALKAAVVAHSRKLAADLEALTAEFPEITGGVVAQEAASDGS
jgi:hypothetical protein